MELTRGNQATPRLLICALSLGALAALPGLGRATGMEIIPSVAMTKSTETDAGDAKFSGGLALRAPLLPFLKLEGGVSYRQDNFFGEDLKVRQWPVTASAWLAPMRELYLGGGVGWYHTTYDFSGALASTSNRTTDKIGLHFGGGVVVPLNAKVGLDLNGRYIFMQKDNDIHPPTSFNPDFWSTSLGLAIGF